MARQSRIKQIEDKELIRAALAGGIESWEELFRRYRGATVHIAQQILGSKEAAEDVSQEALIQAMQQLNRLHDPTKFAPWLYKITRNRAIRALVQERRNTPLETETLDMLIAARIPEKVGCPHEKLIEAERDREIACCLDELSPPLQTVMKLYYYEQWDVARICDFLSVTRTTVKWRLHAGRQKMAKQLNDILKEEEERNGKDDATRDSAYEQQPE